MPPRNWYDLRPLPASTGAWIAARLGERNRSAHWCPAGSRPTRCCPHVAEPEGERLGPRLARPLREVLGRHTTSRTFVAGLWCGFEDIDGGIHQGHLGDADQLVLDPVQSYPHPQPPAFPPEVMSAPRLQLPDREYLLFEAGLDDLGQMVIHSGLSSGGHEPALFWPEDRAWFVATEFDLVVTLVGEPTRSWATSWPISG